MKKTGMKKPGNKLRPIFRESLDYLRESRAFVIWALIIFLFGSIIGFIFPSVFSPFFDKLISELVDKTAGLNAYELIWFIFFNNLKAAFFAIAFGIFLGIFPIVSILMNGLILGYVMSRAVEIEGWITIWRLAPHGVFELPAIFIAVGIGTRLGLFWLVKKDMAEEFRKRFWGSLKVFVTIILPLLAIAAIIEGLLISLLG